MPYFLHAQRMEIFERRVCVWKDTLLKKFFLGDLYDVFESENVEECSTQNEICIIDMAPGGI